MKNVLVKIARDMKIIKIAIEEIKAHLHLLDETIRDKVEYQIDKIKLMEEEISYLQNNIDKVNEELLIQTSEFMRRLKRDEINKLQNKINEKYQVIKRYRANLRRLALFLMREHGQPYQGMADIATPVSARNLLMQPASRKDIPKD
jgi:hypothetical protein